MRVSVVMPVYNRAGVVDSAVRSVLRQRGVEFELIVVDDTSTEPAEEVYAQVEAAGHRVVRLSRNRGPGAARNAGVEVARGEWVAFLDSDDRWLPDKLKLHLDSLERSGLKVGQTDEIWYRDGTRVNPPGAHRITGGDLFRRSLKAVCVSSSTVVLRRSLFLEVGGFDESLFVCEDYALWLRVAAREEFDFCSTPLVEKFGGHRDQLSGALPAMDRFRIVAILKGLIEGKWSEAQVELAVAELRRKTRILSKGSGKRGLDRAVRLCEEVAELSGEGGYEEALERGGELLGLWATRPGND